MRKKTEIRSTKHQAIGSIIGGIIFILFGLGGSSMMNRAMDPWGEMGGRLTLEDGTVINMSGMQPDNNPAGIGSSIFALFGVIGGGASIAYGLYALSHDGIPQAQIITESHDEPRPADGTDAGNDPSEQLRKLKSLYDDRILSTEEYEAKKQEILNKKW